MLKIKHSTKECFFVFSKTRSCKNQVMDHNDLKTFGQPVTSKYWLKHDQKYQNRSYSWIIHQNASTQWPISFKIIWYLTLITKLHNL